MHMDCLSVLLYCMETRTCSTTKDTRDVDERNDGVETQESSRSVEEAEEWMDSFQKMFIAL